MVDSQEHGTLHYSPAARAAAAGGGRACSRIYNRRRRGGGAHRVGPASGGRRLAACRRARGRGFAPAPAGHVRPQDLAARAPLTSAARAPCALGRLAVAGRGRCGRRAGPRGQPWPATLAAAWRDRGRCPRSWLQAGRGSSGFASPLPPLPSPARVLQTPKGGRRVPRRERPLAENTALSPLFRMNTVASPGRPSPVPLSPRLMNGGTQ